MQNGTAVITARSSTSTIDTFLASWEERRKVADMLIKSGFLPKAYKTAEQVLAVMLTAHELQIPEMYALRSIDVIAGTPTVSPELMLGLIYRTQELEDLKIEDDGKGCTVTMKRKGHSVHSETFSMADADLMLTKEYDERTNTSRVIKLSEKHNWRSQPRTMRKWRAVGACSRVVWSDVLGGLYLKQELEEEVHGLAEGEIIQEHEALPPPPPPVMIEGATFNTFDPARERITFGKYGPTATNEGMLWSELPSDYLEFIVGSGQAEPKAKAIVTLGQRKMVKEQVKQIQDAEGDPLAALDKPRVETVEPAKPPEAVPKEDPILEKSERMKEYYTKEIGQVKTMLALIDVTRKIQGVGEAGELTSAHVAELFALVDKKEAELKAKKPTAKKQEATKCLRLW